MQVDPNTPAGVATVIGYFALKITMIVTGAVLTYLGSSGWLLLIFAAFMF